MASPKTTQTSKATGRSSSSSSPSSSLSSSDVASWYCAAVLLFLILMASVRESSGQSDYGDDDQYSVQLRGTSLHARHCDEIYVVGEGETLHTISDKCDDPFIVERNPHIHDPDDVFPGLVIKISPSSRV